MLIELRVLLHKTEYDKGTEDKQKWREIESDIEMEIDGSFDAELHAKKILCGGFVWMKVWIEWIMNEFLENNRQCIETM